MIPHSFPNEPTATLAGAGPAISFPEFIRNLPDVL